MDCHEIQGYKPVFHNSFQRLAVYVKRAPAEYKANLHGLGVIFQLLKIQHQSLLMGLMYPKTNNKCFISKPEKILQGTPSAVKLVHGSDFNMTLEGNCIGQMSQKVSLCQWSMEPGYCASRTIDPIFTSLCTDADTAVFFLAIHRLLHNFIGTIFVKTSMQNLKSRFIDLTI